MRKMSITNSVTAAAEFLTDSLSAFKFRSSLINEAIEKGEKMLAESEEA